MTPNDFFRELIKLYADAGLSKFPNKSVFRGRNAYISSSLEDLFADFLAKNNPNQCTYYIDQPMSFSGEKNTKYPDIVIQNPDGVIEHLIDMKADLGWNRNGMLDFCKEWDDRIKAAKGKPTYFYNGMVVTNGKSKKKLIEKLFSENLHYHIVVATQYNSGKNVLSDYDIVKNNFHHVSLYILSDNTKHPNDQTISQEELLSQMFINTDEFERLLSAVTKLNR